MIPAGFDYHAPTTLADALALMGRLGPDAKLLAGGHSLLPMMKLRFAQPEHLIDLNRIPSLRGIREDGDRIVIGAMTVENELIRSTLLQARVPLLPEAALLIADPQVRNRGTIGGDIAHGDPGNDHPALSIALDATFVLVGPNGTRQVKADGFFLGTYMTQLAEDEIMTEIHVPAFVAGTGYAYEKLKRKTGDWATAGAAVVMTMAGGAVKTVRIALTNVAPAALRAAAAEGLLVGKPLDDAAIEAAAAACMAICDPAEDLRGDVDYKTAMAGAMVRRAIRKAASRCQ
jgi:carbon-monoxide dehydrogenase medium subunit